MWSKLTRGSDGGVARRGSPVRSIARRSVSARNLPTSVGARQYSVGSYQDSVARIRFSVARVRFPSRTHGGTEDRLETRPSVICHRHQYFVTPVYLKVAFKFNNLFENAYQK
jgi:hypothetical protein